ncbi:MAG: DnaJ domain-containing protein, partial [Cyanobacteria bacterium P01_F01_bin.42]
MSASQNYYRLLRVDENASDPVIKQAFRRLARECHPDLHPDNPEAEMMFKLLQEAYDVLGDRTKRRQYDRLRALTGTGSNLSAKLGAASSRSSQLVDPQRMYTQGVELASQRKYDLADQRFSQAIKLNPEFIEAYMGRCQVRYVLEDDRGVLDDCSAIIQLRSQTPQAHYYQGRARHRLSYVENAIQAYSTAISLDQRYAAAYYYRGLARSDVRERKGAIADLKAASRLYRSRGNQQGARKAESQLRRLRRRTLSSPPQKVWSSGVACATALINPVGTLGPLFRALSLGQASALGFGMALVAIVALVTSANAYWPELVSLTWYYLALLGAVPFV